MKYKVKYSKIAIRDLDRIWSEVFEASKNQNITIKYIDDLMKKIESKSNYPKSGSPLYYENGFTGYYYIGFKAYIAFYRIEKDSILVDRVLLGKSDYMRSLHLGVEQ